MFFSDRHKQHLKHTQRLTQNQLSTYEGRSASQASTPPSSRTTTPGSTTPVSQSPQATPRGHREDEHARSGTSFLATLAELTHTPPIPYGSPRPETAPTNSPPVTAPLNRSAADMMAGGFTLVQSGDKHSASQRQAEAKLREMQAKEVAEKNKFANPLSARHCSP